MIIYPKLHLFRSWQTDLHTLQGYNSNSPPRTGLQHVFVRPSHLHTRRLLSLLRTAPLYTSGAATCYDAPSTEPRLPFAPHLRRRTSPRLRPDRIGLLRCPAWTAIPLASERTGCVVLLIHSHLRHRRSASFRIAEGESCSCETTLT
jgi:hypothetical protein